VYFIAFDIFCGHLVYISPFWYFTPRNIWQPFRQPHTELFVLIASTGEREREDVEEKVFGQNKNKKNFFLPLAPGAGGHSYLHTFRQLQPFPR
jgi:hypothetical protein